MSPRILIIDDSRLARSRIEQILEVSGLCCNFVTAADGQEGFEALDEHEVDLVVCDVVMPNVDGCGFLELMSADPRHKATPVIMLSAGESVDQKVRCLSAGASDFAAKDVHPAELVARVRAQLQLKTLRDELEEKNAELTRIARVDPLTGIANRLRFMEGLAQESNRTAREGGRMAVCMVDVDHFKSVNDEYGHPGGDRVLFEVASRLESVVRIYDLAGRLGGDEFGLLITDTGPEQALALVERCRREISGRPIDFEGRNIEVTTSIGLASAAIRAEAQGTELLRLADGALYEAKQGGRNQVAVAKPAMPLRLAATVG